MSTASSSHDTLPTRGPGGDRARAIEILTAHYSAENVLLTEPTAVTIFRERLNRYETWEVVLWNVRTGAFVAWRREGGLKARAIEPDSDGRVAGVPVAVLGQNGAPAGPAVRPAPVDPAAEFEDEETNALASQYLKHIEKQLKNPRRGSLDNLGGSIGAGLRDIERSERARREAQKQEKRWESGDDGA